MKEYNYVQVVTCFLSNNFTVQLIGTTASSSKFDGLEDLISRCKSQAAAEHPFHRVTTTWIAFMDSDGKMSSL